MFLLWNPYSGAQYEYKEGQGLVQDGQQFIEVEVVSIKQAKVSFE